MESQDDDSADGQQSRHLPRPRNRLEASWPSRTEPVDRVLIQAMMKFTVMTSMPVKRRRVS